MVRWLLMVAMSVYTCTQLHNQCRTRFHETLGKNNADGLFFYLLIQNVDTVLCKQK